MDCMGAREQIGAYLDKELGLEARRAVEAHLAACPTCAEELESSQALAAALAPPESVTVPERLWGAIEERLDRLPGEARPKWVALSNRLRLFRRPLTAAAGLLLVVGLGLLGLAWLNGGAAPAEASTIDFRVLLDALPQDAFEAFRRFLHRYDGRPCSVLQARRHAPGLNFAIPDSLPGGFTLNAVYRFRFGENPGVAAEYSRQGELLATIFHPPVREEDFGTHQDYPCAIGMHRGHAVQVGPWRLVHLTDPTTCHCVLSRLDPERELPAVMAAVAPESPARVAPAQDL
jgi:hypothetical protein